MKMKIKIDSRKIEKGDTFIALRGIDNDGHNYINKAIENGASKIICEEGSYSVETIVVKDTRKYLIDYLKTNYYDKINKLKVIGITGTNGKTSSAYLLYEALNKLGKKCGYIGTIGFYMGEKIKDLANTTPDIYDIYDMLLNCYDEDYKYVVIEISSQGLANKRVEGLDFDYAVFTNLTQDHLDYHKTMKNYALAKQELFYKLKENGNAIINYDDSYKHYFLLNQNNNITYGFNGGDFNITNYELYNFHTKFDILYLSNKYHFETNLIGKYNIYNLIVVISILFMEKIDYNDIKNVILDLKLPEGRLDVIKYKSNSIIVDYAHTPDGMKQILETMLEVTKGNIYVVFGCRGNRDKIKRPIMSQIACKYSKYVIMTHNDPNYENQEDIYKDMIKNLKYDNYEIIRDRKNAIIKGINLLKDNDTLLILGKGHEKFTCIEGEKIPFNDMNIVKEYLSYKENMKNVNEL